MRRAEETHGAAAAHGLVGAGAGHTSGQMRQPRGSRRSAWGVLGRRGRGRWGRRSRSVLMLCRRRPWARRGREDGVAATDWLPHELMVCRREPLARRGRGGWGRLYRLVPARAHGVSPQAMISPRSGQMRSPLPSRSSWSACRGPRQMVLEQVAAGHGPAGVGANGAVAARRMGCRRGPLARWGRDRYNGLAPLERTGCRRNQWGRLSPWGRISSLRRRIAAGHGLALATPQTRSSRRNRWGCGSPCGPWARATFGAALQAAATHGLVGADRVAKASNSPGPRRRCSQRVTKSSKPMGRPQWPQAVAAARRGRRA